MMQRKRKIKIRNWKEAVIGSLLILSGSLTIVTRQYSAHGYNELGRRVDVETDGTLAILMGVFLLALGIWAFTASFAKPNNTSTKNKSFKRKKKKQ